MLVQFWKTKPIRLFRKKSKESIVNQKWANFGVKVFHVLCSFLLSTMILGLNRAFGQVLVTTSSTIYVDMDATGANNGNSWEDAYTDLEPGLAAAEDGDQVWVAAGTYLPTAQHCSSGNTRYLSFQLKDAVGVYGGFDPSTGDVGWDDRDWVANEVILSGDIGIEGDNSDNSYHVFCHPQGYYLNENSVLDGFTITGGNANGVSNNFTGGGMYNESSSPTLTNLVFSNNFGVIGGGMVNGSSPSLNNVTFINNSTTNDGGGIWNYGALTLTNAIFSGNTADRGGGMLNESSWTTLTNVTFFGNTATNCGGGMFNLSSSPTLINITFSNNHATVCGGGMRNQNNSKPMIINATFSGNTAYMGGGMYNNIYSSFTMINSILWGDSPDEIDNDSGSNPVITYSDIQGGYNGTGNINENPLLGPLADNGGFVPTRALGIGSPAIDAGNPDMATCPSMDARGVPRPIDGDGNFSTVCDMGSYEYLPDIFPTITTITSDVPDPSQPGQPFTATVEVTSTFGIPTGIITVSVMDNPESCTTNLEDGVGACTLSLEWPGTYTLTAEFSGDDFYLPSNDTEYHLVELATSATVITADNPDPSLPGQPFTATVEVTSAFGLPTGIVTVTVNGSAEYCTANLEDGAGHCGLVLSTSGSYSLTAAYSGDDLHAPSTSPDEVHIVDLVPTLTMITSDIPDPSLPGQSFTATVEVTSAFGVPSGVVTVTVNGNPEYCSADLVDGVGQCGLVLSIPGSYSLTAAYSGDDMHASSTSPDEVHMVNLVPTLTTITSDLPDPSLPGQPFMATVEVTSTFGIPTGVITITVMSSPESCSANLENGVGACTLELERPGTYTLTAEYSGDDFYLPSTSPEELHIIQFNVFLPLITR